MLQITDQLSEDHVPRDSTECEESFIKVGPHEHPLPRASEVAVYFQDYHRSSSKIGRFGRIVGLDPISREYLVRLDDHECLAIPVRRVEWRRAAA